MTYDLTKVHEVGLEILCEVGRICRKYKIKYMLDSGTPLGAVRHHGFILWDDDVDIAFTRKNYEAFLKAVKRELSEGMSFLDCVDIKGGKVFYDFMSRIIYDNSRMHRDAPMTQYYDGKLNHLWVDLFVIEELPAGKVAGTWTPLLHKVIYGLTMSHRFKLDYSKYSPFYKLVVGDSAVVGRLVSVRWLSQLEDMVAKKDGKGRSSRLYYNNYVPDYHYVIPDKEWCENTVNMEFEGVKLMAPVGYHQVLALMYGDYMKLPSEDERAPAHSSTEIQIFG